jgi:hypothetical protein
MFARRSARNNPQLISETSGMMPNFAGVERFFASLTFKVSGAAVGLIAFKPGLTPWKRVTSCRLFRFVFRVNLLTINPVTAVSPFSTLTQFHQKHRKARYGSLPLFS